MNNSANISQHIVQMHSPVEIGIVRNFVERSMDRYFFNKTTPINSTIAVSGKL